MLAQNIAAVVCRNEHWTGACATEPYECGWAREAIVFVRALKAPLLPPGTVARVQISPDGMHWTDEGTTLALPQAAQELRFARVTHFGGWLRLVAELPEGAGITLLVTLHLKE
ncbi:hypothetical protein [Roseomonas haemaphysalidis]|uniref:Uncharacterized protein n=1 Tax=Roseomonas haemaphysalidis TaxID=2768162 RepID=A0ABS3KM06_9PROT|nr:hypothetical protein [Roseomonas haemaphysalidis]MBO1078062.1 hypothetical protein [Roseomonas haemaphysalidis]